jgi:uncharacterized protein (TIGR03083 family)
MDDALPDEIRAIATAQVERLAEVAAGLSDADLVAPTRCAGWLAAHLLMHVRLGLAEHALSFAEPGRPGDVTDRDYVSYWRDWPPTGEQATFERVRFHWANGSAYATADGLRQHLADTARQAAGMSRQAPGGLFRFQEHVMTAEDLLAMWTVEWVVHHLDLTAYLPGDRPAPTGQALALAVSTLDGLTGGGQRPGGWDDVTYVLKGTGRLPLAESERDLLGERAGSFPAFG